LTKALIEGEIIIAIDFDGTITTNPDISESELILRPECKRVLNRMFDTGVKLILWTCRTGEHLTKAKAFLFGEGLYGVFTSINDHIPQVYTKYSDASRKVGADLYLDDKNFGCDVNTMWTELEKYIYGEE